MMDDSNLETVYFAWLFMRIIQLIFSFSINVVYK